MVHARQDSSLILLCAIDARDHYIHNTYNSLTEQLWSGLPSGVMLHELMQ